MATSGWAIGGGVPHSPAQARRLTYAATGSAEGVGSATDLQVLPLAVPGEGVRVVRGSALIRSRYLSAETETYQGSVTTEESLATTPTGSGAARSDLIVMQVEDPWAAGSTWPIPGVPETAECFPVRVISGVPAGTKRLQDVPGYQTRTAVTLARIDFPASTGTVTAGMIADLRKVAQPRSRQLLRTYALVTSDKITLTSTGTYPAGGQTWPTALESAWGAVEVPEWAVRCRVVMTWAGVYQPSGDAWGGVWVQLGEQSDPNVYRTQMVRWDAPGAASASRTAIIAADDFTVPVSMRGTDQRFIARGNVAGGAAGARPSLDWGSSMVLQVEFYEQAI